MTVVVWNVNEGTVFFARASGNRLYRASQASIARIKNLLGTCCDYEPGRQIWYIAQ